MAEENVAAMEWFKKNQTRELNEKDYYTGFKISSEFADCSTCFALDIYSMCSVGCIYCFAIAQKSNNPAFDMNSKVKAVNTKRLIDIFEGKYPDNKYYKHFIKNKKILHIGGMADNFCFFEKKFKKGLPLIEYLLKTGYPTIISTKFAFLEYPEYKELFERYKDTANMAIQSSIITTDPEIAARVEVGVPTPQARLENLKKLSQLGYYTILRLRPFIIGVSDKTLDSLLQSMLDYNIDAISTEFFCMDCRVSDQEKSNYRWMSKVCGFDIEKYYKELSPTERGTYRRLNRKVKEPFIKKMYQFCKKHNKHFACSDPDFKELNQSPCCCGLSNDPKWSYMKNQLTGAISRMRKDGKRFLEIKDVIVDEEEHKWWIETGLFGTDCVCKTALTTPEVSKFTYWMQFKKDWNNLRSPRCPYNYFMGKLKPSGQKDKEGNIIYEYVKDNSDNW